MYVNYLTDLTCFGITMCAVPWRWVSQARGVHCTVIHSHLQTYQVQWLLPGKLEVQHHPLFEHQHERMLVCVVEVHEGKTHHPQKDEHYECG